MYDPAPETKIDLQKEVEALRAEVKALTEALQPLIAREARQTANERMRAEMQQQEMAAEIAFYEATSNAAYQHGVASRPFGGTHPDCSPSRSDMIRALRNTRVGRALYGD